PAPARRTARWCGPSRGRSRGRRSGCRRFSCGGGNVHERHAAALPRSSFLVGLVHFGVGCVSYRGGGKAAAQEELCPFALLGAIRGGLAAVMPAQLVHRADVPVHLALVQQLADRRVGQAVGLQFHADARRTVALGGAVAQEHPGEAFVVLVVLLAEPDHGLIGLVGGVAALAEFAAQFALRLLAACEQAQRLVVGAGAWFLLGGVVTAFHARRPGNQVESAPSPPTLSPDESGERESSWSSTLRLFQRFLGRRGGLAGTAHQQAGAQLGVDLVGDGGVVAQELAHVFLALADAIALVAVPGAGLVDQVLCHAQLDD